MNHVLEFQHEINQCIEDMKNQGYNDSNHNFRKLCRTALMNDSVIKVIEMNQDNVILMNIVSQDAEENVEYLKKLKEKGIVSELISIHLNELMKYFQTISLDCMKRENIL